MDRTQLFLSLLSLYIASNITLLNMKQLLMKLSITLGKVLIWTLQGLQSCLQWPVLSDTTVELVLCLSMR
jgi:hypothetical protein